MQPCLSLCCCLQTIQAMLLSGLLALPSLTKGKKKERLLHIYQQCQHKSVGTYNQIGNHTWLAAGIPHVILCFLRLGLVLLQEAEFQYLKTIPLLDPTV